MSETTEPQVVEMNPPGMSAAPSTPDAPKRAWFADEVGFTGQPIEYGDAQFYSREVKKSALRQFTKDTQRIQRETKLLAQNQADEIKALQVEGDESEVELSEERGDFYEGESERMIDGLDAAYNALLSVGIIGWSLPRAFSKELLFGLEKVDKVALCQAIGSRSTSGFEAVKNSQGRLKR